MNYGFTPSKIDGTENVIDNMSKYESLTIPTKYSYETYMGSVKDQGANPTCVPYSISSVIDWKNQLNGVKKDMSIDWIFEQRNDKTAQGMSIKEALSFIKNYGYVTTDEYKNYDKNTLLSKGIRIDFYARLVSYIFMQRSLILNGPFILALPVYDSNRNDFWNGSNFEGGHAVCCVGYDESGLIIRNSWGSNWGNSGYTLLPYNEINKVYEAWALI